MRYLKIKDIKRRNDFLYKENYKKINKIFFINLVQKLTVSEKSKIFLNLYLKKYFTLNSKTKLLRRCLVSNRSRSVLRPIGLSRITLRNFIHGGILPGYKKAVW